MLICTHCFTQYIPTHLNAGFVERFDESQCVHVNFGSSCPKCGHEIVDVDEEIIPHLVLLWEKGYKTLFSCAGHVYCNIHPDKYVKQYQCEIDTYIIIDTTNLDDNIVKGILEKPYNYKYAVINERPLLDRNNHKVTHLIIHASHAIYSDVDEYYTNDVTKPKYACYELLCDIRKEVFCIVEELPDLNE